MGSVWEEKLGGVHKKEDNGGEKQAEKIMGVVSSAKKGGDS